MSRVRRWKRKLRRNNPKSGCESRDVGVGEEEAALGREWRIKSKGGNKLQIGAAGKGGRERGHIQFPLQRQWGKQFVPWPRIGY